MKTITLKCHVYQDKQYSAADAPRYSLLSFKTDSNSGSFALYVGPVDVEYTIPTQFNPVAAELELLAAKREEAGKLFAATVREIDERIGKLTAIGYEVSA